jgi:hypothetical protein
MYGKERKTAKIKTQPCSLSNNLNQLFDPNFLNDLGPRSFNFSYIFWVVFVENLISLRYWYASVGIIILPYFWVFGSNTLVYQPESVHNL